VTDAQKKLDDLKALSPIITAPFDGFITSIKTTGGAQVYKGSVAMQLADPNQFQATFMVSETDIFSVKVGQAATVSVDALSSAVFPAKVTAIAPLATVSSGVVNYKVTAEITSLIPQVSGFAAFSGANGLRGSFPTGAMPSGFPTGARPSGFPTGAMPSGMPTGAAPGRFPSGTPPAGSSDNSSAPASGTSAFPAFTPKAVSLKQGLSASVTITITEKKNVLTVPLRAITTKNGQSTVQVVEGTLTKTVDVTTGMSDSSNIEITSGLKEGETVIVKASGTTSSFGFGPGGGGLMIR
jgi:multidrug efflux pump subunit AcrA (membrane-fusion protein)